MVTSKRHGNVRGQGRWIRTLGGGLEQRNRIETRVLVQAPTSCAQDEKTELDSFQLGKRAE